MPKKELTKKMGWIILIALPSIYLPSIIAYKTIHYLNSGVDIVSVDDKVEEVIPTDEPLNINDFLGYVNIGPLKKADTKHVIERINLIKHLDLDYQEFGTRFIDEKVLELSVKDGSTKYTQNESVLVEYVLREDKDIEFKRKDTTINFSLLEKSDMVKFDRSNAYISKLEFEQVFSNRFLKLGPLNDKVQLIFSYDKSIKPKNVKATYEGISQSFVWSYSIENKK